MTAKLTCGGQYPAEGGPSIVPFSLPSRGGEALYEADRHAKKELKKRVRGIRPIERQVQGRSDREAPAIRGYCSAVRSASTASFHGKLRDELLNAELFADLREAKALAAAHARWVSDSVATRSPISASLKPFCSSKLCRRSFFLQRHTPRGIRDRPPAAPQLVR